MEELVDNMILYLNQISIKSKLLNEEKWASVFKDLNCKEQQWKDLLDKCEQYLKHNDTNESDDDITNLNDNTLDSLSGEYDLQSECIESVKSLKVKFEQYISRMPVLGFCSSNYDTVLISNKLAMKMDFDKTGFVIKIINTYLCKENIINTYLCMENEKLCFQDLANYLSIGTSYAQFLASVAVRENKGFCQYYYIINID